MKGSNENAHLIVLYGGRPSGHIAAADGDKHGKDAGLWDGYIL